jgi:ABC-type transporter Mla subunit MlaD
MPVPGLILVGLGLGSAGSRRKKRLGFLLLWIVLASLLILPACGGGSSAVSVISTGTPAGTYTVTITGQDANGVTQTGGAASVAVTVD